MFYDIWLSLVYQLKPHTSQRLISENNFALVVNMPTDGFQKKVLAALHTDLSFGVKNSLLADLAPWRPQTKADHNELRHMQERRYREYWAVMPQAQQRDYLIKAGADPNEEMPKLALGQHLRKNIIEIPLTKRDAAKSCASVWTRSHQGRTVSRASLPMQ